nr:T9SS type A sorting domain-containing protein [Bacteroidota bacterium]
YKLLENLYFCATDQFVHYTIVDISGRTVATPIPPKVYSLGLHKLGFRKPVLSPGIYIFILQADDKTYTKKVIIPH